MDELRIDSAKVEQKLIRFIRTQAKAAGFSRVVIGLSGGLDSAVVVHLSCCALGKKNVFALILPYRTTPVIALNLAKLIACKYEIKTKFIDITPQIDIYFKNFCSADKIRRGNKMARERMSILYDQSKEFNAVVVGTSNKTERLLGYGTIHGDTSCAFNPLGGLYKTQVRQLAQDTGIPGHIIRKAPSADFWPGQTDEKELGFSYDKVDRLLYCMIDKKYSDKELQGAGFKKSFVQNVRSRIDANAFKLRIPPVARI